VRALPRSRLALRRARGGEDAEDGEEAREPRRGARRCDDLVRADEEEASLHAPRGEEEARRLVDRRARRAHRERERDRAREEGPRLERVEVRRLRARDEAAERGRVRRRRDRGARVADVVAALLPRLLELRVRGEDLEDVRDVDEEEAPLRRVDRRDAERVRRNKSVHFERVGAAAGGGCGPREAGASGQYACVRGVRKKAAACSASLRSEQLRAPSSEHAPFRYDIRLSFDVSKICRWRGIRWPDGPSGSSWDFRRRKVNPRFFFCKRGILHHKTAR
jgi:hypothetical protein